MANLASMRPGALQDRTSVRRIVGRFALAGLAALVLVIAVTAWASRRVGTSQAIADARRVTWVTMRGVVEPALDDGLLTADPAALARVDDVVRRSVLGGSLVRVKVWGPDGTILYSDEPRLIGQQFDLGDDEQAVLAGGAADAEVSDLTKPENRFETETKLLEVYAGTHLPNGTPVLFETYFRYSGVTNTGRDLWLDFAPIAIGALVLLELIQLPLAWSMARRLDRSQRERERLLSHAIAAGDAERRRIASDLHDGVVQDLTGLSLHLTAVARSGRVDHDDALDAAASIRTSIKSLRSLLVEIYPPNLQDEGLESALGDLVGRLSGRGIEPRLTVDLGDVVLAPETAALLYRTAQEALRNVVAHSQAEHVGIDVRLVDGDVELVVDDDGCGFDDGRLELRSSEGHLGLRAQAELALDLGGRLTVTSTVGAGTRLVLRLPAPPRADSPALTSPRHR